MQAVYIMKDIEAYFSMVTRAKSHGKKPGDSMQEEFQEVIKEHPEWFDYVGKGETDIDMIAGELRDKGVKVLNISEVDRRAKNK